ncbi:hypothetical protein ACPCG0_04775 [Propionibacteriaceae bacterium Y1923]|uniref:hypothetical protein n=1 Tax=Aestuariimicrobium sp. Y1814 TaxID=3418742 RepID=UPI003C224268
MGSGLIFAILVVGWLAYLIPWLASRRETVPGETTDRFAESMTVLKRSSDPLSTESHDPLLEVSTPLTRSAGVHEIRESHRLAARRRLRVVLVLLAALLVTVGLFAFQPIPAVRVAWWVPVIPAGLLAAFLVVARFSVISLNKVLDARMEQLTRGWQNETIALDVAPLRQAAQPEGVEHSIELSGPIEPTGSLWDPIPVTAPTYVSRPMVPRTVRTIDLAMPALQAPDTTPVTAEPIDSDVPVTEETLSVDSDDYRRAVGE